MTGSTAPAEPANALEAGARPAEPAPWNPPMLPFALGGTAFWAVLGLAMLPFQDRLAAAGNGTWIWTCLAGFLIGLLGIVVMRRHDANRHRGHAS